MDVMQRLGISRQENRQPANHFFVTPLCYEKTIGSLKKTPAYLGRTNSPNHNKFSFINILTTILAIHNSTLDLDSCSLGLYNSILNIYIAY